MPSSVAAWRLQTSQLHLPPSLSEGRCRCASVRTSKPRHFVLSSSSLWRLRGWKCRGGKLLYACSRSSTMWVMVIENFPGRVDTAVDLGSEVSDIEFVPDILDIRYRENNRAAPPVVPHEPPSDGYGASELDFEIYASNSMENYEPPPPPRMPFGFPFEDYYDAAIGVDYISKEEKPSDSLLQFLDSLHEKKADDGGNSSKRPLFVGSHRRVAAQTASGKSRAGSDTAGQVRMNGSRPEDICISSSEAQENLAQSAVASDRAMEESSEQAPISMYVNMPEQILGKMLDAQSNTGQENSSSTSSSRVEDSGLQATVQPVEGTMPSLPQGGSGEDLAGAVSATSDVLDEANFEDMSFNGAKANAGSAPSVMLIEPSQNLEDVHASTFVPANSTELMQEDKHASEGHGDLYANIGMPSLASPPAMATTQAQNSLEAATQKSRYYEPEEGDVILGAVTFINDHKADLEIGAELSALMTVRELRPFSQNVENIFYEIPSTEASCKVPLGASLLVKDETAADSFARNGLVSVGTVVLAEVTGRSIIDGRAILSCKALAQRLAWQRIEQLMRLGETVQVGIVQWNEGGLLGYVEGVRAFLPKSELLQRPESISVLKSYVGRTCTVALLQTDKEKSNVVLSEVRAWMSKNLQLGTVHDVTVTKVHSYGMQVQVENTRIRGFVHKTNFSKEYVSSVSNYFAVGDKARVMLIKGRNLAQISFGLSDLEKENGLLLRDKEQVFKDSEEMGKRFQEQISEEERQVYGLPLASEISPAYRGLEIANLAWLHLSSVAS